MHSCIHASNYIYLYYLAYFQLPSTRFSCDVSFPDPSGFVCFCQHHWFVLILRSLIKSSSTITSTKKTSGVEQARRGVAISVYLGLTWIAGFLAIGDVKLVFQYLFFIFNSLQGFLIFLFYCVLSTEVREKYRSRFWKETVRRLIAQPRWHPNPWPLRWSNRREK